MATKIIKHRLRNILFALVILSAVFLPFSGSSLGQKSVAKAAGSTSLVISGIKIDGDNGDQKNQSIALYNPTTAAVTMTNWRLARKDSNGVSANLVASLNGIVQSHGWFLIVDADGYDGYAAVDSQYSDPNNLLKSDNTVLLYSDQGHTLVDKVGYGAAKDFETSPFPTNPSLGNTLVRSPAGNPCDDQPGQDTNNNSRDIKLYEWKNCIGNATDAVGDVVDKPEDGSWNPDAAIDFPNGNGSEEELGLRSQVQADGAWWKSAMMTATTNCSASTVPNLHMIMSKTCWQKNVIAGAGAVVNNSLLTSLYSTYWPDLTSANLTNGVYDSAKANSKFIGTQAWIDNPIVLNLDAYVAGRDGIDALGKVYTAGWGIEADRLFGVFNALFYISPEGVNGNIGITGDSPMDDILLVLPFYRPARAGFAIGDAFVMKVTKWAGSLVAKNVKTGYYYVVKVANAALAKTLTNRVLADATRADLNTMVVRSIQNGGTQAVEKTVFKRTVDRLGKFLNWKVVAKDAVNTTVSTLDDSWFRETLVAVGNTQVKTLMRRNAGNLFLDAEVSEAIGGRVTLNLTRMFAGINLSLKQQRYAAATMAHLMDTMYNNPVIAQAYPKFPGMIQDILSKVVMDNSPRAQERGVSAWADYATGKIHIPWPQYKMNLPGEIIPEDLTDYTATYLNDVFAHESTHLINNYAMKFFGTKSLQTLYEEITDSYWSRNPINEGLTEWVSRLGKDAVLHTGFGAYDVEVNTIQALRVKLIHAYQTSPSASGLSLAQVGDIIDKSICNGYIRYGPAAFDRMIVTSAGPFNSQVLANKIAADVAKYDLGLTVVNPYIQGLNITKINLILPANFAP